jgi:tetrahydromethanopterin S-methyltransferase subunit C
MNSVIGLIAGAIIGLIAGAVIGGAIGSLGKRVGST